jgi:hypothetical protein
MGRLRGGEDSPLFMSVNEEIVDLFGNEDGVLHRFDTDASCPSKDPLWDEPTVKPVYIPYNIPYLLQDWATPIQVDELGQEVIYEATLFISRTHLQKAGVPVDGNGDHVRPGDRFESWHQGDRIYFDLIGVDRQGYVNDSDNWTQYVCVARRSTKYVPEKDI